MSNEPSGLGTTAPAVWLEQGCLYAKTSKLFQLLTLGIIHKSFKMDPRAKLCTVDHTYLWFMKWHWEVPFSDVREVSYEYHDMFDFMNHYSTERRAVDCYSINLELWNGDAVTLFRWLGIGEYQQERRRVEWFDLMNYNPEDHAMQKSDSLVFLELVKHTISTGSFPKRT